MSSRVGGRGYDPVYDDRDYYRDGGRHGGGGGGRRREVEEVDVDISRSRDDYARSRGPDFLREDYGRSSNAGPVVLAREEPRRRPDQRFEEEEILIKRGAAPRDRPRGPSSRYERDDVDVDIRRGHDADPRPSRREREDIDIDIHESEAGRSRRGPPPEREEIDIRISDHSRNRPPPARSVVDREEIDINIHEDSKHRRPDRGDSDITFRRGEGERSRHTKDVEREDITIRRGDVDDSRHRRRDRSVDRLNIDIREGERGPPSRGPRSHVDREEIDIRIREEERRRRPDDHRNTLVIREKSQDRSRSNVRPIAREREDYYFRRRSPSPPPRHETEEIVIRRRKSPSPSPSPPRAPSPPSVETMPEMPAIVRPPIHQEIITHHRTIDHGHVRAPSSSSSSPSPAPSRRRGGDELEIGIKRRDERGNTTEQDIRFVEEDFRSSRREREREEITSSTRHRSRSAPASRRDKSRRRTRSRHRSRSHSHSHSHSHSRSRSRERKEKLQVSIDINNAGADNDKQVGLPRPPGPPSRPKEMWTEITKDLVSKEAIEYAGFRYEETGEFFYVMEYLRYEDVTRLVELSEDLYRDRHNRIEQIQWERRDPRLPEPRAPEPPRLALEGPGRDSRRGGRGRDGEWDERIYEREVIYEDGSRQRFRER